MKQQKYEKKHLGIIRRSAPECTVLLRTNGDFPIDSPCEIGLFGNGARHTMMGGTGSGEVNSHYFVNAEEGLKAAGFTIASTQWLDRYDEVHRRAKQAFLQHIRARARAHHTLAILEGMGAVMPEPNYRIPLPKTGDVAVYVLSRVCGEGSDRAAIPGDIRLSRSELRDITTLQKRYDKFLLVLNVGGPVDLTPLDEVKNILILSQLGADTGHVLADLILGRSYPSGKLSTTWTGWEDYPEIGEFGQPDDTCYYEGIYVGYRYFDSVGKKAMFPFGFGLGYTSFEYEYKKTEITGETVCVKAEVRNTGSRPGKETLQLYVSVPAVTADAPYQTLAGFAKTSELSPGEKEELAITFRMTDLSSYSEETSCYYLDAGNYICRLGTSSTDTGVCSVIQLEKKAIVKQVKNVLGSPGFPDYHPVIKRAPGDAKGVKTYRVSADDIKTIQAEYKKTFRIDPRVAELSDEELALLNVGSFSKLPGYIGMIGNAGVHVAGAAGETTSALEAKGIRPLVTADGPAGLRLSRRYFVDKKGVHAIDSGLPESFHDLLPAAAKAVMSLAGAKPKKGDRIHRQYASAIPIGVAIAQSWNTELARTLGDIVGDEMERFGVDLWLAPALNIHRDIRCGRNFEYFSEDPLLTGRMAAAITDGVQAHPGRGVTIKHFAANNQEYNRTFNNSRVSERAMREIYLRGFEICIGTSHPLALMTSYNLLNGTHTSENKGLIWDILRHEWDYDGIVMTDWLTGRDYSDRHKYKPPRASKIAAVSGDLCMPGEKADYDDILSALRDGRLTREELEINASRQAVLWVG